MGEKFNKKEYDRKNQREKYDKMTYTVLKGGRDVITKAAEKTGKKSINEYVVEAIQEKLKREDLGMVYANKKATSENPNNQKR